MGCTSSKEAGDAPAPRQKRPERPLEDRIWEADQDWARTSELFAQYIADREDGKELALESRDPEVVFASARTWLGSQYRDCAWRDSIEAVDPSQLQVRDQNGSPECWMSKKFLVMDSGFTGEMVAVALVVSVPVDEKKPWLKPGDMVGSKAMEDAKKHLIEHMAIAEPFHNNLDNAEILVFMGADVQRARWRPSVTQPTITPRKEQLDKSAAKAINGLGKQTRGFPEPMRLYLPMFVNALLPQLQKAFAPQATVWDEGELQFSVNGSPYPYPARVLVSRDETLRDKEVEAKEFKVTLPEGHPMSDGEPCFLWRNSNPEKDPGGVICMCLAVPVAPDALWPKVGDFEKGPVMRAAADAFLKLVKAWNRQGKVQRCVIKIDMGFDTLRYSLVGSKLELPSNGISMEGVPVLNRAEGDLDSFYVKLEPQREHHLFDSEEHFQNIKAMMRERMQNDPERYKALALETSTKSAARFLEMNYPQAEVGPEENLPITFNGREAETGLVVARHPGKTEKDIIAAVYAIPSPDGELPMATSGEQKVWLNTPEAQAAVDALLGRMQQWQREGRIADGECMGQVMIGMDADIYLFVDGRFEDPSEERMAQINWG